MNIDFVTPKRPSVLAVAVLGVLSALLFALGGWIWALTEQTRETRGLVEARGEALAAAKRQQLDQLVVATGLAPAKPYEADARRAIAEAEFRPMVALSALEHVAIKGVTPTLIDASAETGLVAVDVEFAEQAVLLNYLAELNTGESPARWKMLRFGTQAGRQPTGTASLQSAW